MKAIYNRITITLPKHSQKEHGKLGHDCDCVIFYKSIIRGLAHNKNAYVAHTVSEYFLLV